MDSGIIAGITLSLNNIVFGAYFVLLLVVGFIIWRASRDPNLRFKFSDSLIDPASEKASLTRILQLIAGFTATFVILWQAVKGSLTYDLFGIYVFAMGLSEGFSKWVAYKTLANDVQKNTPEYNNASYTYNNTSQEPLRYTDPEDRFPDNNTL